MGILSNVLYQCHSQLLSPPLVLGLSLIATAKLSPIVLVRQESPHATAPMSCGVWLTREYLIFP